MTDVGFYHLTTSPLERALPRLLEKTLELNKRAVVVCASEERLDFLNSVLWTLGKLSFIPHGSAKDGYAADQPVWLTTQDENPNGAQFLFVIEGAPCLSLASYERCFDIFDGNDADALAAARERWKKCKDAGHQVTYWKQNQAGAWEKG